MSSIEIYDAQAESGVVATLVYHPEYILHSDYLKAGHFFNQDNGCIYWAIQELYRKGIDNIDAFNISNMLASHSGVQRTVEKYNLPQMEEYIDMCDEIARHSLEEYSMLARTVTTFAFKRKMSRLSSEIDSYCHDKTIELGALSEKVYKKLASLTEEFITSNEIKMFGDVSDGLWGEICDRRNDSGTYGIPSKYASLNEYFTYEPGEMVVVQAKYKQGKSVFLLNETVHKLKNGVPTLVVDTEMSDRLYMERLVAHVSGVEVKRIKNGRYNEDEGRKIREAISWIKQQPFVHIYDPDMTDDKMYSICKILKFKMGLQFVVYDYIKSNETSSSDNYNILGAKCDFLKNKIAGELNLAVLSACQLNRNGEVADSMKINRYLSVGIKWFIKSQEQLLVDGAECGNAGLKIYVNRLGQQMPEDDETIYLDFFFEGDKMNILEAKQHMNMETPFD